MPSASNATSAIALRIVSGFLYVAMAAIVRGVSDRVPLGEIVFCRSAFAIPPLLVFVLCTGTLRHDLATANPVGHLRRSFFGAAAIFLFFASLSLLPLAFAQALMFLTPVFTSLLAVVMLGERVGARLALAAAVGFGGVLVMLSPQLSANIGGANLLGAGLTMIAALSTSMAYIETRRLTRSERPAAIAFYFQLFTAVASLATVPAGWVAPRGTDLALLLIAGSIAGVAQIALTLALARAPASLLAPFEYLSLVWAVALGIVFFSEWPSPVVLAGAALVAAAAIVAARSRSA